LEPLNTDELAALYEDAPCGYLSFTADGTIVRINRTLLSWLGNERDNLVSKRRFLDLITRGGKFYYEMFYLPLIQLQSKVNEINFDFVRRDGTRFPALVNSSVIRDSDNKILVVHATVFDITDRKRYENDLLEARKIAEAERNKFEILADFMPEMIWTADAEGIVNYANQRFTAFFGIHDQAISAKRILLLVHSGDRLKLIKKWVSTVRSGDDFQIEVRLGRVSGTFEWYLIRALPIREKDGQISKWMGSCTNINQHVLTIQHLDQFISIASHELKTPITTLKASLQLLNRFVSFEGKALKLMSQANKSIGKIDTLVQDLLHAGNIKEGQMTLHLEQFNVLNLLEDTCGHVSAEGKYQLKIQCSPDLTGFGDRHRIDQVLVNFVNNAVKYAPDSKEIVIAASARDGFLYVSVKDNGPGILANKLPYVFDRYYRVSNSDARYSGMGLGLYISSEIIRKHGGEIGVESKLGEGTTFWFSLPLKH
jgi:PAS domain S-box-containing protein